MTDRDTLEGAGGGVGAAGLAEAEEGPADEAEGGVLGHAATAAARLVAVHAEDLVVAPRQRQQHRAHPPVVDVQQRLQATNGFPFHFFNLFYFILFFCTLCCVAGNSVSDPKPQNTS